MSFINKLCHYRFREEYFILSFLFLLFNFCTDKNPTQPEIENFNGKVTILDAEDRGYGIPYVKVTMNDSVFYSDSMGVFFFNGTEDKNIRIKLEHNSYFPINIDLEIETLTELKFYMQPKISLQEKIEYLSFFPLAKGYYWEYRKTIWTESYLDTLFYSVEVDKDTLFSNGKKYWKIIKQDIYSSSFDWANGFSLNQIDENPKIFFVRIDEVSGSVYRFSSNEPLISEVLIYSAFLSIGSSYSGFLPSFHLKDSSIVATYSDLRYENIYNAYIKKFNIDGDNNYYNVARGIGYAYRYYRKRGENGITEAESLSKFLKK